MLKRVTITGADDSIFPEDLVPISEKYPFVEWGILLSATQEGCIRFPTLSWIERFHKFNLPHCSGHMCGRWVRDLAMGNFSMLIDRPQYIEFFQRIQLNFHAVLIPSDPNFYSILRVHSMRNEIRWIFQIDGTKNSEMYETASKYDGINAFPLYDLSHGAGISPEKWLSPINSYCGYAGGLGPDNLEEEIQKILKVSEGSDCWIDMETKVRSDDDIQFDLGKVIKCLEIAQKYVDKLICDK